MHAVLPAMIEAKGGKIVNVGGTFGMKGRAGRLAYSASKWGLRGITKSFALEAGPYGINVNCVAPGMVDGPRFREKVCANMAAKLGITLDEAMTRHAADYALKRVSTDADVANACLFLASDVSRQITGRRSAGRWWMGGLVSAARRLKALALGGDGPQGQGGTMKRSRPRHPRRADRRLRPHLARVGGHRRRADRGRRA
jgi:NAD(P)-dependent dehydrogenase (short-subunit alcohol dehydrogenase family)